MLLLQHPLGQGIGCIVGLYRHDHLRHDGAVVVLLVHEVHGHPGHLSPGGDDGLVHPAAVVPLPAESRQQGRVDVQHGAGIGLHHLGWNQFQIAGQDDEVDAGLLQGMQKRGGFHVRGRVMHHLDAVFAGIIGRRALGLIGHHQGYPPRDLARFSRAVDCPKIGPAAGNEYGQFFHTPLWSFLLLKFTPLEIRPTALRF
ncbi:hypothetical protein ES703_36742 [subsurface metagenome]